MYILKCIAHNISAFLQDGDEQKRRLLPKTFQTYPLIVLPDHVKRYDF